MDTRIQSALQSGLVHELSKVPNNLKRFSHDIPDNAPYRSFDKAVVNPYSGNINDPKATLCFRIPRLGYLNRIWLRVRLHMPNTPFRQYVDPEVKGEKPRGAEFFASFFENAELFCGGKSLEVIYAENVLHEVFKHNGPASDMLQYGLKGLHSFDGEDDLGELSFDTYHDSGGVNLPTYANFLIPLNFSVFNFYKDSLDTGFLQELEVVFRKRAIRGMQEGYNAAYTRVSMACTYHNFHPHFKNQVRNANFTQEPSTLLTNQNYNFLQTPKITKIPKVSTIVSDLSNPDHVIVIKAPDVLGGPYIVLTAVHGLGDSVVLTNVLDRPEINNRTYTLGFHADPDTYTLLGSVFEGFVVELVLESALTPGTIEVIIDDSAAYPLNTGDIITISGLPASTNANGTWEVIDIGGSFELIGSVYNEDWTQDHILSEGTLFEAITQPPVTRHCYNLDLDKFVTDVLITFRKKDVADDTLFVGEVQPTPSQISYTRFTLRANDRTLFDKFHHEMTSETLGATSSDIQDLSNNDNSGRFFGLGHVPQTEFVIGQDDLDASYNLSQHREGDVMYRIPLSYICTDEFQSGGLDVGALTNVQLIIESEAFEDEENGGDRKGLEPSIILRCRSITRVNGRTGQMYVQV